MQPTTVYTNAVRSGTIRSAKDFLASIPSIHQCVSCGMLMDEGPLQGIFPTDADGKLVRYTVKQAVLNWCPTCREEHERFMRQLEEMDNIYEGME